VLTLARSPPKNEKEKQQRLVGIQRNVSHAIRPAPSPPEASRSTNTPPSRSPIITVVVVSVFCLVFVILFKLFIAWQCSLVASWCTLCVGTPKYSGRVMVCVLILGCAPDSKKYNMKCDLDVLRDASEAPILSLFVDAG